MQAGAWGGKVRPTPVSPDTVFFMQPASLNAGAIAFEPEGVDSTSGKLVFGETSTAAAEAAASCRAS